MFTPAVVIERAAKRLGMNDRRLAERIGVTPDTVSKWKTTPRVPEWVYALKLLDAAGMLNLEGVEDAPEAARQDRPEEVEAMVRILSDEVRRGFAKLDRRLAGLESRPAAGEGQGSPKQPRRRKAAGEK